MTRAGMAGAPGWLTVVVGANFERLVAAHDQTCLAVLLVLQQADVTGAALLPFIGVPDELEQLGAHLEELLLGLLVGLDLDLLGEADNGLEVDILGLWCLVVLEKRRSRLVCTSQH